MKPKWYAYYPINTISRGCLIWVVYRPYTLEARLPTLASLKKNYPVDPWPLGT